MSEEKTDDVRFLNIEVDVDDGVSQYVLKNRKNKEINALDMIPLSLLERIKGVIDLKISERNEG